MNIKHKLAAIFVLSLLVLGGGGYFLSYQYSKGDALFLSAADLEYYYEKPTVVPSVMLDNAKNASSRKAKPIPEVKILGELKVSSFTEISGINSSNPDVYSSRGSAFGTRSRKSETITISSGGSSMGPMAYGGSRGSSASSSFGSSGGMMGGTSATTSPSAFVPFAPGTTNVPLSDPGADPDPNSMIPVGNGVWILIVMALGYGLIKSPPTPRGGGLRAMNDIFSFIEHYG